jgi:molybdopterin-synthase adenylyltransferase
MVETAHDRQRLIPGWRQELLANATVVVAGVGAIGNEIAKNLALAGTGRLILCDQDKVSVSNLNRSVLFTAADVGRAKAQAAAENLHRLAPEVKVEVRTADLVSGVGLGELADAALIVGCVDTLRARMQLLGRCALVNARLVDAGTHPWGGEVRLRVCAEDACHACVLTEGERGRSDLPWSCQEPRPAGPDPASIATTALIAGWATMAALDVLLDRTPAWRILAVHSAGRAEPVQINRDPRCPYHHPWPEPAPRIPVSARSSVADLLAELGPGDEPESWAELPLPARCRVCGDRPAAKGDLQRCEQCGALLRPVTTTRLRAADPSRLLCGLGVAPEEILSVRGAEGGLRCVRLSRA